MEELWVCEYGNILLGKANEVLPDGNLCLRKTDFDSLLTLLEDEDSSNFEPFFRYARPQGRPCLKVLNYVGVMRTASGTQIEILPKLSKKTTPSVARELLLKMLIELEDAPFRVGTTAELEAHNMPLFEILFRYFLDHVAQIVHKGIARTYVSCQENLVYLRGKLQLTEHIRRNSANSARVFCEFDEFEMNRPINRLIRGALDITNRLTADPENQQRCRELLYWFENIPATDSPQLDFKRVQRDRMVRHYEPAMPICRLILEGLNPLTHQGERQVVSMLFPMEKVFEGFVAAKLQRQFSDWNIRTQVGGQALIERHMGRKRFNLYPDLELRQGAKRIIADTKWKLINQADRSNKYGISQADIYQLYGYLKKYLGDQKIKEVYLIYPKSDMFSEPLAPFWYEDNKELLWVVPYDLEREKLLLPDTSSLNELTVAAIA